jgi:hypothetical protein
MNIGSFESRNGGPDADGELFIDRSEGLNRDVATTVQTSGGLSVGLNKSLQGTPPTKSLIEAVTAKKTSSKTQKSKSTLVKKTRRKNKKWKKPRDKPNRPLSAYNLFFAHQRAEMLGDAAPTPEQEELKKRIHCKTHGKIGFGEMARTIGAKWKALGPDQKKVFEDMALKEKERYQKELATWKEAQKNKPPQRDETDVMSTSLNNASGASIAMNSMSMLSNNPFHAMQAMQMSNKPQSESMRLLFESSMNRRNISRIQPGPHADYIRNMHDLPVDQAALLGMSQRQMMLDASQSGHVMPQQQLTQSQQQSSHQYPTAAEASANSASTLLNHFQPGPATPNQSNVQQDMERQFFEDYVKMRRLQQRFIASGGYGMGGMNTMNMNAMNMSMNMSASGMSNFGLNGMGGAGGAAGNMSMGGMGNMSMRGGGMGNMSMGSGNPMNMNNFGMNNN